MENFVEEIIHPLTSANSAKHLFSEITSNAKAIGFEYCAYGLLSPIPITKQKILMMSNYPESWQNKYRENNYISIDSTVRHGIESPLPLLWTNKLFYATPTFWEEARAHGLNNGWSLSIRSNNGFVGMLTMARENEPLSEKELSEKSSRLIWLAQTAHVAMASLLSNKLAPELDVKLTIRELEVLKWSAEGKTSNEIADILCISYGTVNYHVANAINKLQTVNKNAAIVRAAMLGLL
jgi:LuxR family transcriptional regulator, quorum-sensing system regulator SolR